ncbi:meiotic recombination protein spo11 [Morchella snyderi]|nr:meiotic recombination protein spo11 [Morchella snyderi]
MHSPDTADSGATGTTPTPSTVIGSSTNTDNTATSATEPSTPQSITRTHVLHQIESIFHSLVTTLSSPTGPHPLTLLLTPRPRHPTTTTTTGTLTAISFPTSAHRFTCILKILAIIHTTLTTRQPPTTKRDIFYQHPTLFRTQAAVDRIIDDLTATFRVPRHSLGIVASAKGLAHGDFTANGRTYSAPGGGIIMPGETAEVVVGRGVEYVLIVEKEAVFRTLCSGGAGGGNGEGIVVTGKGYPDVATRELVKELSGALPVFAVVDMDPYGIEIMATYKFGSIALAHESHRLAVERVEWLGIKTGDLEEVIRSADGEVEGVMVLTERDRRKAVKMLGREWMERVPEWRSEIQKMLVLNVKVEIEILSNSILREWIDKKISEKMNG